MVRHYYSTVHVVDYCTALLDVLWQHLANAELIDSHPRISMCYLFFIFSLLLAINKRFAPMDYCLNHDVSVSVWNYYIPVCLCYEGLFHGTADTCQTQMFIIADITKKLQAS